MNQATRTLANRVAPAMCANPYQVKACDDCMRNRSNRPAGTWSQTPDIEPAPRNGRCGYHLGGNAR